MVPSQFRKAPWPAWVLAVLPMVPATPAFAAMLNISVIGVRSDRGWLDVCVFDSAEHFPNCGDDRSIIRRHLPALPGTTRIDVDVAPGRHAVSVLHDENGNGRLDTNLLGMPREGAGVSNNPPPRMGPPLFSDAVFLVPAVGRQIVVQMVYP